MTERWCTGCGRQRERCEGCRTELDPPRYCARCGRRMTVTVTPTSWRAECRRHGQLVGPANTHE